MADQLPRDWLEGWLRLHPPKDEVAPGPQRDRLAEALARVNEEGRHWRHKERSKIMNAAYRDPAGLPAPREGQILGHWKSAPTGSRGGAPIWVMEEAMGFDSLYLKRHREGGRLLPHVCSRCGRSHRNKGGMPWCMDIRNPELPAADPDGFAIFGRFPKGWLDHILRLQLLGSVRRDEVLHVCSGTLGPTEKWTADIRHEAKPRVVADGAKLPFRSATFRAVICDPPYSDEYARNLYGVDNPRPSWLLREAARVVKPSGRIGLLHVAVPLAPPGCFLVGVWGVSCGVGFRIRAFTVFQRNQESLL